MKVIGDNNRWFLRILIAASVAIWGTIGYQFWNDNHSDKSSENSFQQESLQHDDANKQPIDDAFLANLNDQPNPFIAPGFIRPAIAQSKPPPAKSELPMVPPPPLRVTGLLIDGMGKIAVIENQQNDAQLAAVGDSLFGVRILSINENQVKLFYLQQEFVLEITKSD